LLNINIETSRSARAKYDESLFEVYVLNYDDNYHRRDDEPTSEFERAVRNIKGRYKDLEKFSEAVQLYEEWMDYLATKHHGRELLKKKIKAGAINDFIPRKPRLKNNKTLKYLYKHNIVLSSSSEPDIDMDVVDEYIDVFYNTSPDSINIITVEDKEANKLSEEYDDYGIRRKKPTTFMSDAEWIDSYFNNRKIKKGKKNKSKKNKDGRVTLTDMMSSSYEAEVEDSDNSQLMLYNSLLLSAGTTKEMEVYHKLDEMGWNSYKLMKRANYSKRISSIFKVKKKKKKKKSKNGYDELLIDIMTDNGYDDFADFSRDMLNMTSDNIFK